MRRAKNIYFLLIKKKRDGPRQGVAQGRLPSPTHIFVLSYVLMLCLYFLSLENVNKFR